MKKVFSIILIIALCLSLCACKRVPEKTDETDVDFAPADATEQIAYTSQVNSEKTQELHTEAPAEETKQPDTETTESAAETPAIGLAPDKSTLTYKETKTYDAVTVRDIYTDDKGNEYFYDTDGNLLSFWGNIEAESELNATADGNVDETAAAEIARGAARSLFGGVFDGFEFNGCQWTEGGYRVTFVKKIEFAIAAQCNATVQKDGSVTMCGLSNYYGFADRLDPSLLDGVERETVVKFAEDSVKDRYGDNLKSYETDGDLTVLENDGKLCIAVKVRVEVGSDPERTTRDLITCYYEL